ncbi:hypothetical protein [Geothrix fuzhouensis]|uniref:hypothetical protein n=1 Tax=Geothrix fuzhouensis TaxID=2966451 RepID=UPI00214745CB|nr:hypothetical protein [Geothrix fuzhouensis]
MAELILTEEEKAAATWLELPDEAVGKLTKKVALDIVKIGNEQGRVWTMSAALILIGHAADMNATTSTTTIEGFTHGAEKLGDWEVTIKKLA